MKTIEAVLRELGISYRDIGEEAEALCPAHDDRKPSWYCNLKTGVHHCFSCNFSGNLASLVSHVLGLTYPESVIWVNSRVGWARAAWWREDVKIRNYSPQSLRIFEQMTEAEMALFTDPPEDKLKSKNITLESARLFGVKWNPAELTWIFPIRDPNTNELWGWQLKNDRYFRGYPRGIRKSETLFGISATEHDGTFVLVESPVDTVRLHAAGIRNGISSFGVSVSAVQFSLILRDTEHLVLALDNDRAGVSETARICRDVKSISDVRIFSYGDSEAKDPGEMTDKEIQEGMAHAIPRIRWLREHDNLKKAIASLPKGASKPVSFEKELACRLRYGTRQDGNWHSFSRRIT